MKPLFLVATFLTFTLLTTAQKLSDILTLKNGSVIRGTFITRDSASVKIKTKDGSLFVYSRDEIEKARNRKEARKDERAERCTTHPRTMFVGFSICPTVSFYDFHKLTQANAPLAFQQYGPRGGFTGGFTFSYFKGRVGFETGLTYMTNALEYSFKEGTVDYPNPVTYYPDGAPERQYSRYHSLQIPLLLTVVSKGTKVRFLFSIGASLDLMLFYVSTDNYYGKFTYSLFKTNNFTNNYSYDGLRYGEDIMGLRVKLGAEIPLKPYMLLRICPALYYGLPSSFSGGVDVQVLFNVKHKK